MAQAGFTPIQLYYSNTATNVPASLANGELAINQADGKIYYRNNAGVVTQFNPTVTAVSTISFGTTGLTPSTATSGAVTVAGTLVSANGGTGFSTYATGDLIYASAANTLSKLTAGTNGFVLTLAAGVPTWAASTGGVTSFSAGTTGLTPNTATTGAIVLAGTLELASGGTGLSSFTAGDLVYFASGTSFTKLGIGTAGQILTVNPGGTAPQWSTGAASGVTSISFGTTGLTPNTATTGAVVVAGTLIAVNGGTGISSYAQGEMLYANTTTTLDKVTANITTSKKYLSQTGTGTAGLAPTWGDVTATNIAGGTAGTLFFNTAADTTTTLSIGTAYQLLGVNAGATAPSWQGLSSLIDNVFTASAQGTVLYRGASDWVALAPGTNGQFLTSGGAAANVSWTTGGGGGGGVTGFTTALNTASPNITNNVSSITASGGTTNQFAAFIPKGTGGILAAVPDSAATGGNIRGTYSVDLQLQRTASTQVASSTGSVLIGGENNTASAFNAAVIAGSTNEATGQQSVIIGGVSNKTIGTNSVVIGGKYGWDRNATNVIVMGAMGGTFLGGNQLRVQVLMATTTDATSTRLTTTNTVPSSANQLNVDNSIVCMFRAEIIATVQSASGNIKSWTVIGAIKRGLGVATTALVSTPAVNINAADAGASTWAITATADTTNGALALNAVGQAATNIRWTAVVYASEVAAA
jgi:hypothetical protein